MTVTRHAKALAEQRAERAIARQKEEYRQKILRVQQAFEPPLSNSELSVGFELDSAAGAGHSEVGRFVSTSSRLRRARPDSATRALIDALLEGDLLIAVQQALPGARREVLVCEARDVRHLSRTFEVRNLAGGELPERASDGAPSDWNDAAAWNLFGDAAVGPPPVVETRVGAPLATVADPAMSLPKRRLAGPEGAVEIGAVGLGAMRLSTLSPSGEGAKGSRPDRAAALRVLHTALDAGLTFIDTADSYCLGAEEAGHNERLIREALEVWPGDRQKVVVATKAGLVRPGGAWRPDGRPEHLRAACEASLGHLGVEALDLLQLHAVDPKVPFEESVGELARLHEEGKIRRIGLSNVSLEQLEQALEITGVHTVQNACSYLDKAMLEKGLVLRCHELGITFIAHSPIGGHRGVERADRNRALLQVAERHEATPRQIALAWLLHMGPSILPIPGASRPETVSATVGAASITLDDEDLEMLASGKRAFARELRPKLWAAASAASGASKAVAEEVTLFIGPPAAGKSDRVQPFLDRGFLRLNRDTHGGRLDDLVPKMAAAIDQGQRAFVLDNTYPTRKSRRAVLELARRHHLPVRCLWLDVPLPEALYNACLRMLGRHGRILDPRELQRAAGSDPNMLPPAAIYRYFQLFEEPQPDEGFAAIERIAFERRVADDMTQKALVLDYDGSLRRSRGPAPFPQHPDEVEILPGRKQVLERYRSEGYRLLGVSNQSAIGKGQISEETARACFERTHELLGLEIDVRFSPHATSNIGVWSRKPMPGLGVQLIEEHRLDRAATIMVGDLESDREFARHCGFQYRDAVEFFGS